jgi:NAD(P)H dehydrogenase (quinone)
MGQLPCLATKRGLSPQLKTTMATIIVVNHSITGTTAQLAQAVLEGVRSVKGCTGKLITIDGAHIVEGRYKNEELLQVLDACDAVIFGCPTFMGGPSAQFKAFADASSDRWDTQRWEGKLCAGFTVGSNLNGDQLSTLQYLSIFGAQHGMLWVGIDIPGGYDPQGRNRLGAQLGLISQSTGLVVPEVDLLTAKYFGARVSQKTLALTGKHNA